MRETIARALSPILTPSVDVVSPFRSETGLLVKKIIRASSARNRADIKGIKPGPGDVGVPNSIPIDLCPTSTARLNQSKPSNNRFPLLPKARTYINDYQGKGMRRSL